MTIIAQVDRPVVPFELPDVRGQTYRSEDYQGEWMLLVFHRHLA